MTQNCDFVLHSPYQKRPVKKLWVLCCRRNISLCLWGLVLLDSPTNLYHNSTPEIATTVCAGNRSALETGTRRVPVLCRKFTCQKVVTGADVTPF